MHILTFLASISNSLINFNQTIINHISRVYTRIGIRTVYFSLDFIWSYIHEIESNLEFFNTELILL